MTQPADSSAYDAVILAGGAGSRLGGVDKAALLLGDRQLVTSALDAAAEAQTLVVVGDTGADLPARAVRTTERPAGAGPAAGLAAGLRVIDRPQPWVAVLGCDLPGARAAVPRMLAARSRDGAVLLDDAGRPQWMLGVYRRSALEAAFRAMGDPTDRSLRTLLADLDLVRIPAQRDEWQDVDTWADHRIWQARLRPAGKATTTRGDDMTDTTEPYEEWQRWVERACAELDLDPIEVDIPLIHDLSRLVAHNVDRPLAPVSTYLLGMAIGQELGRGRNLTNEERTELVRRFPLDN